MKDKKLNRGDVGFEVQAFVECITECFGQASSLFYARVLAHSRYGLFSSDGQAVPVDVAKVEEWNKAMEISRAELKKSEAASFVLQSMDEDVDYEKAVKEAVEKFSVDKANLEKELTYFI